jgi:hyperosmotically inducible protein
MRGRILQTSFGIAIALALIARVAAALPLAGSQAQSVAEKQRLESVRQALQRLPYYGVFDFLAFNVERGTATLLGYAYRASLPSEAEAAVKRVSGIDEVGNKIEVLPVSQNDDRIRWATFYNIYTDDFLSRYAPGGGSSIHYEVRQFRRFPGMQPSGTYPIHIIVKGGRTTLLGVVNSESDKQLAGVRAREVPGVFAVENELEVEK